MNLEVNKLKLLISSLTISSSDLSCLWDSQVKCGLPGLSTHFHFVGNSTKFHLIMMNDFAFELPKVFNSYDLCCSEAIISFYINYCFLRNFFKNHHLLLILLSFCLELHFGFCLSCLRLYHMLSDPCCA